MIDAFQRAFETLTARVRALETADRAEVAGGAQAITFAALPAAGQPGRLRFVTDGRKVGEGGGAGTGTLCYDDGTAWRRCADDTTVAV